MNKRNKSKIETRNKLLKIAKNEFINNGFLKTTTIDITKKAKVAHGTLFLHFKNKENLILKIFEIELIKITDKLYKLLNDSYDIKELLIIYLNFIEKEEDFFSIVAKELPFYPTKLKRELFFKEGATRKYFFDAIEIAIKEGKYKNINILYVLDFLFGIIHYYLSLKGSFGFKNIIKEKKEFIIDNFINLLTK